MGRTMGGPVSRVNALRAGVPYPVHQVTPKRMAVDVRHNPTRVYFSVFRAARIWAAWFLLNPRRAAIAVRCPARGRALPASQL